MSLPQRVKEWLLDLIFPLACAGCNAEGALLCGECRQTLERRPPSCFVCHLRNFSGVLCAACGSATHLRRFIAPLSYRDPRVRELVHQFKYGGVRSLAEMFGDEIASHLAAYRIRFPQNSVLVPIPLHPSRQRERGFNQSALIAEAVGRRAGLRVAPLLIRCRRTDPQVGMHSHEERRRNVADTFSVRQPAETISGKRVILVDDVATSGATLAEAARVLREAGARSVSALAVARG